MELIIVERKQISITRLLHHTQKKKYNINVNHVYEKCIVIIIVLYLVVYHNDTHMYINVFFLLP